MPDSSGSGATSAIGAEQVESEPRDALADVGRVELVHQAVGSITA